MRKPFAPHKITIIKIEVASLCGVPFESLASPDRHRQFAYARHMAMWAARHLLNVPYKAIGDAFGNRDHSTVIKGIKNCERFCREVPFYQNARDILVADQKDLACR